MKKKGITLIELMVVIIVLGIISLIALPNMKNIKNKAELSAAMENKNTVQKGVDKYFLEKQELPTTTTPTKEIPVQIDWNKLVPPYIRSKPADLNKIYYWVDYNNTVWVSDVDAPQGVVLNADGKSVSWSAVTGAMGYEVGYIEETASIVKGKLIAGKSYKELQKVSGTSYTSTTDLTGKTVVVSSISKNFESVPVGAGYTGNTLEGGTGEQQVTTNHKPVAVISMTPEQGLTTATSITWGYENSTDEDGDQITNAEWDGKQDIYSTEGTYTVKLRVQDSKGEWSDWVEKSFYVINPNGIKQITAGGAHTVALMNNGTVKAWGWNQYGQLGISANNGTGNPNPVPTTIPGLTGVKQIATGYNHTIALMNDGTVKAWGWNYYGQLGIGINSGTYNPNPVPTIIPGLTGVKQIATGLYHTVALMEDGTVKAWGYNYSGELGNSTNDGTNNPNPTPTTISGLTGVKQIVTGGQYTIALMEDGTVKAWGANNYGQLGLSTNSGTNNPSPVPTTIVGLTGVKQITGGDSHTVALMNDGTVKAWGGNHYGQLGSSVNIGTDNQNPVPTIIPGLTGVKQIATGLYHTVALMEDGTVKAWGCNVYGQLGNSTNNGTYKPNLVTTITGLTGVKQIETGCFHIIALMNDGTVKAWGWNQYGQLGISTNSGTGNPNPVPTTVTIN